ncbi:MAG: hypothetical protein QOJ96_2198 [Alphaproteobacteria bacterium]|nr:hypothetical protein [Alphaproteobacteria bacterium]
MDFQSANPSVVKSIKQRDLLNSWLRLYVRGQRLPRVEDYQPERLAGNDTLPTPKLRTVIDRDLVHRTPGRIAAADVIEFS